MMRQRFDALEMMIMLFKKKNFIGVPKHEHHPSLTEEEIEDLIRRYRDMRRKEQIFKFGNRQITKAKLKRAFPTTSSAIKEALHNAHSLNPHRRKPLLDVIREVNNTPDNEF